MREIDWAGVIAEEDVEGLWNGLFQLVSRHPAVRPLHFATDGAAVTSQTEINADLTQELFLELFHQSPEFGAFLIRMVAQRAELDNPQRVAGAELAAAMSNWVMRRPSKIAS